MTDDWQRKFGSNALKVVLAICVLSYLTTFQHIGMNVGTGIHISSWIAICSLSGFWIGLGNFPWRFPLVVAIAIISAFVTSYYRQAEVLLFYMFSFGIVSIIGGILFATRLRYGELRRTHDESEIAEALQFNVRDLLIWTTAIAGAVAVGRWLFANHGYPRMESVFMVGGLIGSLVMACLVTIWALLGEKLTAIRLVAFAFVIALLATLNSTLTSSTFWLVHDARKPAAYYCNHFMPATSTLSLRGRDSLTGPESNAPIQI